MAQYDLTKQIRIQLFEKRVKYLIDNKCMAELKDLTIRTVKFNSYFHLCIAAYSMYTGYSLRYTKQEIFKRQLNPDIFVLKAVNEINGEVYEDLKSSADCTNNDLSDGMFNFKEHCATIDFRLPEREDLLYLREIQEAAEQQKRYLNNKNL